MNSLDTLPDVKGHDGSVVQHPEGRSTAARIPEYVTPSIGQHPAIAVGLAVTAGVLVGCLLKRA
jgi:ElaB/YqjD/DUF883 family membrane-anchored ribosome-binding protein